MSMARPRQDQDKAEELAWLSLQFWKMQDDYMFSDYVTVEELMDAALMPEHRD